MFRGRLLWLEMEYKGKGRAKGCARKKTASRWVTRVRNQSDSLSVMYRPNRTAVPTQVVTNFGSVNPIKENAPGTITRI